MKKSETEIALDWWCKLEYNERTKHCINLLGHRNQSQLTNVNIKKIWKNNKL